MTVDCCDDATAAGMFGSGAPMLLIDSPPSKTFGRPAPARASSTAPSTVEEGIGAMLLSVETTCDEFAAWTTVARLVAIAKPATSQTTTAQVTKPRTAPISESSHLIGPCRSTLPMTDAAAVANA